MKTTTLFTILIALLSYNTLTAQKKDALNTIAAKNDALQDHDTALLSTLFHDKATIQFFYKEAIYKGQEKINTYYTNFFSKHTIVKVEVVDRMYFKGVVIDKELVTTKNKAFQRFVFYKFKKKKIKSMTILEKEKNNTFSDVTRIIDKQLQAYNQKNLNAFISTYTNEVRVYDFPNNLKYEGLGGLKREYSDIFKLLRNIDCTILQRMVLANVVIDYEEINADELRFNAIAIYEVVNGLINKVYFIE